MTHRHPTLQLSQGPSGGGGTRNLSWFIRCWFSVLSFFQRHFRVIFGSTRPQNGETLQKMHSSHASFPLGHPTSSPVAICLTLLSLVAQRCSSEFTAAGAATTTTTATATSTTLSFSSPTVLWPPYASTSLSGIKLVNRGQIAQHCWMLSAFPVFLVWGSCMKRPNIQHSRS